MLPLIERGQFAFVAFRLDDASHLAASKAGGHIMSAAADPPNRVAFPDGFDSASANEWDVLLDEKLQQLFLSKHRYLRIVRRPLNVPLQQRVSGAIQMHWEVPGELKSGCPK